MEEKGLKLILDMDMDKFNSAINNIKNKTNALNNDISKIKQSLKFDGSNVQQYTALVEKLRAKYNQTESSIKDLKQILDASLETGKITKNSSEWVNLTNKIIVLEKNLQITGRNIDEVTNDWKNNGRVGKDTLNGLNRELQEHKSIWQQLKDGSSTFFGNLKANLVSGAITGGLQLIQNAITGIVNGFKKLASGYINLLKTGVDYNSKLQDYTKSIGIILDGDEARAAEIIKSLKQISGQVGYEIEPLVQGVQRLVIAGVGIEDARDSIVAISQALRLVGADSGALDLVITNLMQLQTQGGATARDLREFATKGIPIYKLLADYSDRFAEGTYQAKDVKFEDILGALLKAVNDPESAFSKSIDIAGQTFSGQIGIIEQQWLQLLGGLAGDTTSILTTEILPTISGFLQSMTEAFDEKGWEGVKEAFAEGLGSVINVLLSEETINAVLGGVETIIGAIEAAFDPNTPEGAKNKETLSKAIDKLLEVLGNIIERVKPQIIAIGESIGGAIFDGIKGALSEALKNYFQDILWKDIKNMLGFGLVGDFLLPDKAPWRNNNNVNGLNYSNLSSNGFGNGLTNNNSIVLNTNINVSGQITNDRIEQIADTLTDRINNNLGRMVK